MLEGTGHIGYLVPLLIGVAVANLTGNLINGDSFYEEQLRAKVRPAPAAIRSPRLPLATPQRQFPRCS